MSIAIALNFSGVYSKIVQNDLLIKTIVYYFVIYLKPVLNSARRVFARLVYKTKREVKKIDIKESLNQLRLKLRYYIFYLEAYLKKRLFTRV